MFATVVTVCVAALCAVALPGSADGAVLPTFTTTPIPAAATVGPSPTTLKDRATLSGGDNPTGTITFRLTSNGGATLLDTETVIISGNGAYATPVGYTLPTTGTVVGTYQWDASYSGDSNNTPVTHNGEQVTVSPAVPNLTTTPEPAGVLVGSSPPTLKDNAVLSGGGSPTGTITFRLTSNGGATLVDTETVVVSGNGTYMTPVGYTLPTTSATATYQWDASYSGDPNNDPVSENSSPNERVSVAGRPTVSISSPASGATYALDEHVVSSFSCADGIGGPGISSCLDQSNAPSASQLDTSTAGPHTFTVTARSADGLTATASVSYTVAGAPAATITSPAGGKHYALGQRVLARFTCAEGSAGPGISACTGTVAKGAPIDTAKPGRHTFSVEAISSDGQFGVTLITYTVLPSNRLIGRPHFKKFADGTVIVTVRVPGPGAVRILETTDPLAFGRAHATAARAETLRIRITPTARGLRLVAEHTHRIRLTVSLSYTPTGGERRTVHYHLQLPG